MSKANNVEDAAGGPVPGDWPRLQTWATRHYVSALRRLQEQIGDSDIDATDESVSVADDPLVMVMLEETAYWAANVLVAKELKGPR